MQSTEKITKANLTIDKLKTIKLNACGNYLGGFGSEKAGGIILNRPCVFDKDTIDNLSSVANLDKVLKDFIANVKKPITTDDEKSDLLLNMQNFLQANPLLVVSLRDKGGDIQPAIYIWYKRTDNIDNAQIKSTDGKFGYKKYIYINANMDKSYGVESENPRIKISSGINAILNYQLFKSCAAFGDLISTDLIFINDLIDPDDKNYCFNGPDIINRGYYDDNAFFAALKGKAAGNKKQSPVDTNDFYA